MPSAKAMLTPPIPLTEKELKKWARLRMAHEAVMVEDARSILNQNRDQVRAHAAGFTDPQKADDMPGGIYLGDVSNNYYNQEETKAPAVAPVVAPVVRPTGSTLGKLALAAAFGIPLTAAAVMAPSIIEALNPQPPAPVVVPPFDDTDTNTQYELEFFED